MSNSDVEMLERSPWERLREPFPAALIGKLPKGGVQLDYVGHAAVTDRLLQVDPTWTWEPLAMSPEGLPALDRVGNLWIRLTVNGVTRIGVGDGKNAKECISDAIRNAAMRFGVALDLWAKEDLQAANPPPDPKPEAVELRTARRRMHALFREAGINDRGDRLTYTQTVIDRAIVTSTDMTVDEVKAVSDALTKDPAPPADPPGAEQAGPQVPTDPGAQGPAETTYTEKRTAATATPAQLDRLDELVNAAIEDRIATIHDMWLQVAAYRRVQLADLINELGGADPGRPGLLWAPLRNNLRRAEAGDLTDHLEGLRKELGLPETDIPF